MNGVQIPEARVRDLAARLGGEVCGRELRASRLARPRDAGMGDLAPLVRASLFDEAREAATRGASILASPELGDRLIEAGARDAFGENRERALAWCVWRHPHAAWAMAEILDTATVSDTPAMVGEGSKIGEHVVLGPRVVIGKNVTIGHGAVIGSPGFGWIASPKESPARGAVRAVPQLGGVIIEDDVHIGPLTTVDAGTLAPTRVRRGAKIDAHVHVGHNVDIGEGCIIAAQVGFAGSVTLGAGVLVGGQAGFGDHVTVGAGARIAGGSGVIGDVPPGDVVAGYPAVPRVRWLRSWAWLLGRAGQRKT